MWMKLTHKKRGPILVNSDRVLYMREVDDEQEGKDCEIYFNFQDFVLVDEPRAEVEKQLF
jgi:hypothetical protein